MPHAGGGGNSGGGHGGGSSNSSGGSSTPHYTKSFHPTCGYLIHGHYYDAGATPSRGSIIFCIIWMVCSCVPLSLGIVHLARHEAKYDEDGFFDYSLAQYEKTFGPSTADYEDHVLTVFAMDKSQNEYHYYSIVGDNVKYNVDVLFGNNNSTLGGFLTTNVPKDYSTNFDEALVLTISKMQNVVVSLGNDSNLKKETSGTEQKGSLVNEATCFSSFDASTVTAALTSFQDATGIGYSIAIENFDKVFTYSVLDGLVIFGVGALFLGIGVFITISSVRTYKELEEVTVEGTSSRYYYDESKGKKSIDEEE